MDPNHQNVEASRTQGPDDEARYAAAEQAHAQPPAGAEPTVETMIDAVIDLVADMAREGAAQAELNRMLMSTLRDTVDEQGDIQRELAWLRKPPAALARLALPSRCASRPLPG